MILVTYKSPEHTLLQIGSCSEPIQVCSQVPWSTPGSHQQPGAGSAGFLNTAQPRTTLIYASLKVTTMCSFGSTKTLPPGQRPSVRMPCALCPAEKRADLVMHVWSSRMPLQGMAQMLWLRLQANCSLSSTI